MSDQRKIVVTAALPYANGDIHIGHLVEYLQTDFWTRFQKMRGHECVYMCADDTHGTPIMIRAMQEKIKPEELIARSHDEHLNDFTDFEIAFDNYSSTNSPINKDFSERLFAAMEQKGHIAIRSISQNYCETDSMFLPDRFVKGTCPNCSAEEQYGDSCDKCAATYASADLIEPHCVICGNNPVTKESEHVFFKLNDFKEYLRSWVPEHTAPEVSNKLLEWFDEDLRDWDISRDSPYFGFEIPGHPGKYFYVWVDAPIGYMTSLQEWCNENEKSFDDYWNNPDAELYHFIGKDIVRFHALFWPSILDNAGFKTPNQVFVHGFLTVNGEKMSKSKGTFVNARTYLNHLDPMYLRFYYGCKLNSSSDDIDLSFDDFVSRVNSDLLGKITNLASRGAQMLNKKLDGKIGEVDEKGLELIKRAQARSETIAEHMEARDFGKAMVEIRDIADQANRYFDEAEPWASIKTDPENTLKVLSTILNIFRILAIYLKPILPRYAEKVENLFKETSYSWADAQSIIEDHDISAYEYLASRVEQKEIDSIIAETKKEIKVTAEEKTETGAPENTEAEEQSQYITIDDFAKVDLRVGEITSAEAIEGADKLLNLKVNIGEETRNVIAGIKLAYNPEDLIGRRVILVVNLKPRKMKFGTSEGMILAAGTGGEDLFVLSPDDGAKPGQQVR
jgi:methionyl-tRNA synthetase